MMYKSKMIALTLMSILLMIICLTALTGCSDNDQDKDSRQVAVAFVLGAHGNSQGLNLNSDMVKDELLAAAESFGMAAVICNDGAPEVVHSQIFEVADKYKGNKELLRTMAEKEALNMLVEMQEVKADDAEVDTLESLRLAVRALASAPEDSKKIIIVLDTGLSTAGIIDFRNNLISAEPAVITEKAVQMDAVPDFGGITVKWQGIGDVASPQQNLTPAQANNLKAIWEQIIVSGNGQFQDVGIVSDSEEPEKEYPEVSVVELPQEATISFDPAESVNFDEPRFISEEQVQFVGDSDEYKDPDKAESVLRPVAEYMVQNTGFSLLLAGTTAGDNNSEYTIDLSMRRAERVKATLVSLGAGESSISTIGLGCADPWHIPGAGTGSSKAACQNRKVVLADADSQIAKDLQKNP